MKELIERIDGAGPPIALLVIIVALAIYRALAIVAAALRAIGDTHDDGY